jgi:hypothetical protein
MADSLIFTILWDQKNPTKRYLAESVDAFVSI